MNRVIFAALVLSGWCALASAAEIAGDNPPVPDAARLAGLADRLYRAGKFDDARAAYERALAFDANSVPAHLGMARIAGLFSRPEQARANFARAFQADPSDADAVLGFASVVEGQARETLLSNFLALNHDERHADVFSQLEIERRLAGRPVGSVADAGRSYRLPLAELCDDGVPAGLVLRARINGGPVLNLQLDSGAKGLLLNPQAAREAGLEILANATVFGLGSAKPAPGRVALASRLEIGPLEIRNVLAAVGDAPLVPRVDGLIGLEVFQDFLIRLDARGRRLELEPLASAPACGGCAQAYRLDSLLLVRGTVNGRDGNFIVDTGSPITLISRSLAGGNGVVTRLTGVQGDQVVTRSSAPLDLAIGNQNFRSSGFAAIDVDRLDSRYGTAIAGVIGYSLLRDAILLVDYRHGLFGLSKQ